MQRWSRWTWTALVVMGVGLVTLGRGAPAAGQTADVRQARSALPEDETVRSPDAAPSPPPRPDSWKRPTRGSGNAWGR